MKFSCIRSAKFLLLACGMAVGTVAHAGTGIVYQADQFVDSVGLVVHLGADNYTAYPWTTSLRPLITGLGVRHVRDGFNNNAYDSEFVDLSTNYGIKATGVEVDITGGVLDSTKIPGDLNFLKTTTYSQYNNNTLLSAVEALEGPNEYDNPKNNNNDSNWESHLQSYQQALYKRCARRLGLQFRAGSRPLHGADRQYHPVDSGRDDRHGRCGQCSPVSGGGERRTQLY